MLQISGRNRKKTCFSINICEIYHPLFCFPFLPFCFCSLLSLPPTHFSCKKIKWKMYRKVTDLLLILRRGLQLSTDKYSQESSGYILFPKKLKDEASTNKYMLWPQYLPSVTAYLNSSVIHCPSLLSFVLLNICFTSIKPLSITFYFISYLVCLEKTTYCSLVWHS